MKRKEAIIDTKKTTQLSNKLIIKYKTTYLQVYTVYKRIEDKSRIFEMSHHSALMWIGYRPTNMKILLVDVDDENKRETRLIVTTSPGFSRK